MWTWTRTGEQEGGKELIEQKGKVRFFFLIRRDGLLSKNPSGELLRALYPFTQGEVPTNFTNTSLSHGCQSCAMKSMSNWIGSAVTTSCFAFQFIMSSIMNLFVPCVTFCMSELYLPLELYEPFAFGYLRRITSCLSSVYPVLCQCTQIGKSNRGARARWGAAVHMRATSLLLPHLKLYGYQCTKIMMFKVIKY